MGCLNEISLPGHAVMHHHEGKPKQKNDSLDRHLRSLRGYFSGTRSYGSLELNAKFAI